MKKNKIVKMFFILLAGFSFTSGAQAYEMAHIENLGKVLVKLDTAPVSQVFEAPIYRKNASTKALDKLRSKKRRVISIASVYRYAYAEKGFVTDLFIDYKVKLSGDCTLLIETAQMRWIRKGIIKTDFRNAVVKEVKCGADTYSLSNYVNVD